MRDALKPIIKTKEMSINFLEYAFVNNQDDKYYFILMSAENEAHFEIKWERENELNLN